MVKIDLITGFLGAGKTTFIRKYASYLIEKGENIGILENDFGAVNIDMMLLQDLMGDSCELEMISGGCDADCHKRRFKTKLISMKMCGYDRIIVEPSGIYDVDEFFDVLREEPLDKWYEIGSIITIVDAGLSDTLNSEANYLLASEAANAGCIVLSRVQDTSEEKIQETLTHVQSALKSVHCDRILSNEIIDKNWDLFTDEDMEKIIHSGYKIESYEKMAFDHDDIFDSLYFMNKKLSQDKLSDVLTRLLNSPECGNISRIKGFMQCPDRSWLELNATHKACSIRPIENGQEVIIVIGEHLVEDKIEQLLSQAYQE